MFGLGDTSKRKTKVGLIFDDGFIKSTLATADLFEEFKLPAVFAVIAAPGDWAPQFVKGDFSLWNELQQRGHIVQPHGFTHAKLDELPYDAAVDQLRRCLGAFQEKLDGFDAKRAVYMYAYNSGTPRLNDWLLGRVHAMRQGGSGLMSQGEFDARVWHSDAIGPDDPGPKLLALLDRVRRKRPAVFLHSLHGTDGEGWGAIALSSLRRVLEIVTSDPAFTYWPVAPA
jgi:peptidoglycan/xylan/chitin deacetylase (PgdA/CDA1 family)